ISVRKARTDRGRRFNCPFLCDSSKGDPENPRSVGRRCYTVSFTAITAYELIGAAAARLYCFFVQVGGEGKDAVRTNGADRSPGPGGSRRGEGNVPRASVAHWVAPGPLASALASSAGGG